MKKIVILILIAGLSTVYAQTPEEELQTKRLEWSKAYLEKKGLPVPDGGIKIVPRDQMSSYKENPKLILKKEKEVNTYGYILEKDPEADTLFNLKEIAQNHYKKYKNNYDFQSTHLRHSINDLKIAYTFLGVPENEMSEMIGISPYLTYIKGQGWAGASQLFINNEVGNCSFDENNVRLTHGSVIIQKEKARNDINSKTTVITVLGTEKDGFVYVVDWYDPTFFRTLKCANKKFSEDIKTKVIELAKRIDTYNSPNK